MRIKLSLQTLLGSIEPLGMKATTVPYLVLGFVFFLNVRKTHNSEYNLPLLSLDKLAENFGQILYEGCLKVTAVSDLRIDYLLMDPSVHLIDGHNLTNSIKSSLRHMVHQKVKFLEGLSVTSQVAFERHIYDPHLKMSYPESKNLNSSDFELVASPRFNNMQVNFTMSTVHIPNNVYEKSAEVLNGVAWSSSLDEIFSKNSMLDKELKWQYFCSSTGFFRMFPGTTWQKVKTNQIHPNVFDCRMQKWYIQAATSPKAVVYLFDVGDAMKKKLLFAIKVLKFFLDTLTDEDFFNVIFFSSSYNYIDSCSNSSLMFANNDNKNKVVKYLENLKFTGGKTKHEQSVKEALNIFASLNNTVNRNVTCSRALVLLSSTIPSSLVQLVQAFNQPIFQARIFVYLFNRDKKSLQVAKELACDNKGYHAVLESESQAPEQLLNFVSVLSRPSPPVTEETFWTNVYEDTAGLDLIISVVLPVFSEEVFLGVVGVDISINEFAKLFEQFQLGVDSHVFVSTRKGHAVYHPELKMKSKYKYEFAFNPNSNLVDIGHLEQTTGIRQIKGHMMDGDSGHIQAETTVLFDNSRRIATKNVHYFFTDLPKTPFSLGVSLPSRYGRSIVDGSIELNQFDPSTLQTDQFLIAPWDYCNIDLSTNVNSTFEKFFHQLKIILANPDLAEFKCNTKLLKSLLFDIEATRGSYTSWIKENWDQEISSPKGYGVELVFIGTKGGLTRYYHMSDDPRSIEFIESQASTIHSLYYLRAVYDGEEIFTFSLPFKAGKESSAHSQNIPPTLSYHPASETEDLLIVGSTPIVIHEEGHEGVTAVAGLLLKYSHFKDIFLNITTPCNASKCQKICQADEIDCYLVDYNGYIIYSENTKDIGHFLGELEGSTSILLRDLIIKDGDKTDTFRRGVFRRVERTDYQAVCEVIRKSASRSEPLFNNFSVRNIFTWLNWILNEFVLLLVQFNFSDGWLLKSSSQIANASSMLEENEMFPYPSAPSSSSDDEEATDLEAFRSLMSDLIKISSKEQVEKWKENCLRQSGYNPEMTVSCLRNIKKAYEPGIRGFRPCVQSYVRYIADPTRLPQSGIVFKCDLCTKSYGINLVPRTNLMLLAIDSLCHCSEGPMADDKPIEIFPHSDEDRPCENLNSDSEPPPWSRGKCPASRETNLLMKKEKVFCGKGSLNSMSRTILLLQTTLVFLLRADCQCRPC